MKKMILAIWVVLLVFPAAASAKAADKTSCEAAQFKIVLKSRTDLKAETSIKSKTIRKIKNYRSVGERETGIRFVFQKRRPILT